MTTVEGRPPTPARFRKPWRRYGRLVVTNFLRGASYACGTGLIGLAVWWAENR
ncbi:hypothetical protein [Streptomyces sp. NRRL F-4489]|uniref:hypothetical protein n=1 Tax=Streptomyces sp. NRRL F-4489 TaxID=1609095 RepID=UPI000AAE0AAA|nr:hypothetical protein [Streptomyces sp. NRRL F-4489]